MLRPRPHPSCISPSLFRSGGACAECLPVQGPTSPAAGAGRATGQVSFGAEGVACKAGRSLTEWATVGAGRARLSRGGGSSGEEARPSSSSLFSPPSFCVAPTSRAMRRSSAAGALVLLRLQLFLLGLPDGAIVAGESRRRRMPPSSVPRASVGDDSPSVPAAAWDRRRSLGAPTRLGRCCFSAWDGWRRVPALR